MDKPLTNRGKYAELIDAETWAFIDKTNASFPEDAVGLSSQAQRDLYDQMCAQFRGGYPEGVVAVDTTIEQAAHAIPIRQYRLQGAEPQAQILYFHGGGFVVGGLESHDDVCAELCAKTGFNVTAVDYRLAPTHVFPAAHEDAVAAYHFVTASPSTPVAPSGETGSLTSQQPLPVILVGDSAGGNLAASVAHVARDFSILPIGQVLIYPGLTHDLSSPAYLEHANAPMLTAADVNYYRELVTGGMDCSQDARCVPLADKDFSGLPVTYAFGAGCDPLLDDARLYCEYANAAGGKAYYCEETGLVHGYLRARHSVKRAQASFERIVQACQALGQL